MNEYIWVKLRKSDSDVPIGARVLAALGSRIKIRDDDNNEHWITPEEVLKPMRPTSVFGVEDMIKLEELQEHSILRNIQIRYNKDLIYTYIGSILVAVNPYKLLPLYTKAKMDEYRKKALGELSPHIFAVADHSYESMRKNLEKRCIVISGESGAGKTESTKLFLQYLASNCHKRSGIEQQILDSNPILEAFGNAKTVCNNNSSRFGKYVAINFNKSGNISSAQIKQYLLERSRIVSQNHDEQNYHIFYAILNGMTKEDKRRLGLKNDSFYNYLNKSADAEINESCKIEQIRSAMKVLQFSDSDIWNIFEVIAAILHFGNVRYQALSVSNVEAVDVVTREEVDILCTLLRVPKECLIDSLTKKTISMHGDNVVKFLSKQHAIDSRDAFVKRIYGNLFNYIVNKINRLLFKDKETPGGYIGILDIFGFEAFERNGFEQLCINYANERLQQFFIEEIFKSEQEQYKAEGIEWTHIDYPDNKEILDLFEVGAISILSVINDESKLPKGTDRTMLDKLIEFHSENNNFLKPKYKNTEVFGVKHYAGIVLYDVKNFLEKNYDACNLDMEQVVQISDNNFLKEIFDDVFEPDTGIKKRAETLVSKFKNSLDLLMRELNQCQPFFVRCIKPNEMKKPQRFDRTLCCKQLRYSGMTEATRVREAGYAVRYDFFQFVQRYGILCPEMYSPNRGKFQTFNNVIQTDYKAATLKICKKVFENSQKKDYQLGHSKIFLKHPEELVLENERNKVLYKYAVIIQKIMRGWLLRRRYKRLKRAVLSTERHWMEKQRRRNRTKVQDKLDKIHAKLPSRRSSYEIRYHVFWITRFQAFCRGYLLRSVLAEKLERLKFKKSTKGLTEDNSTTYSFKEFAKKYFRDKKEYQFSKRPIKSSLTLLFQSDDITAAKAIWLTILRLIGCIPEPEGNNNSNNKGRVYIKTQLREIFQRISDVKMDLASLPQKESDQTQSESASGLYENWLKTPTRTLDKLYFIVYHGIVRSELRDEIYCQVCKAITKNPSEKCSLRAWDLLSSCTGCFPPSDLFLKYLKNFIREGPKELVSYCSFRLHRVFQNGSRTQPPYYTELKSIIQQKPFNLNVFLMDGSVTLTKIDSVTTAKEMLDVVAKNIKLRDAFGFSLVLSYENKHSSLDNSHFVLDAISQCEQYAQEIEDTLENPPWKIYLKKEIFAPWHDCSADKVSTELIYSQIIQGIMYGEYECIGGELSTLVAQICYAERGKFQPPLLTQAIKYYVPQCILESSDETQSAFKKQVGLSYHEMFEKNKSPVSSVKMDIIKFAIDKWPLQFSKIFNVFGLVRNAKQRQCSPETPLVVAVNASGMVIIDETNESIMVDLTFVEIRDIVREEITESHGYLLNILTHGGIDVSLTIQSVFDNSLHVLLLDIINTLKRHSKFVVATKDYKTNDPSFLELQKGDFVILDEKFYGKDLLDHFWASGLNDRTGETGNFLLECVEILPTVKTPPEAIVNTIIDSCRYSRKNPRIHRERLNHHTLQSYATKHFGIKQIGLNLWKYSGEKIQEPLHARLVNDEILSKKALEVFQNILLYMDHENKTRTTKDECIVNRIFNPGLQTDSLRDETYCQIIKQITANPNKISTNRGWELMWMITGLFPCSGNLKNEVKKFFESRRTMRTPCDCLERFNKIMNSTPRKHPPHSIEIEAVQHWPSQILYKIYFPDDTHKFLPISSLTKFEDLRQEIISILKIKFHKGFNLFVQFQDRIFLLPEDYYIFDFFQHLKNWIDKNKPPVNAEYHIHFKNNNWKDITPGHDEMIDLKFLYPQEYGKYIQGCHIIPTEDIAHLAALLLQVIWTDEKNPPYQQLLHKLIPSNAINRKRPDVWQNDIDLAYSMQKPLSAEESQVKFLKYLYELPSYGLQYFVVKPMTSDQSDYKIYLMSNITNSIF